MLKIAIIEDEPESVGRMAGIFRELGFEVEIVAVRFTDTRETVAERVLAFGPDMIYADYEVSDLFKGYHVLESIGGKFWSQGNPRVVSISSVPQGAMPHAAYAHFPHKKELGQEAYKKAFLDLFDEQQKLLSA